MSFFLEPILVNKAAFACQLISIEANHIPGSALCAALLFDLKKKALWNKIIMHH